MGAIRIIHACGLGKTEGTHVNHIGLVTHDELLAAFGLIDTRQVTRETLIARSRGLQPPDVALGSHFSHQRDLVVLHDRRTGGSHTLPVASLRALQAASLTGVAVDLLMVGHVVTAGVLGFGAAVEAHLLALARDLPNLSHVAVYPTVTAAEQPVVTEVVARRFAAAGITVTRVTRASQAILGANLIIAANTSAMVGWQFVEFGSTTEGAVVVNASGQPLARETARQADQIFVDQLGPDRSDATAELGQVLLGRHPGRVHADDVVLVELGGAGRLDVALASRLCEAATAKGLEVVPLADGTA
jgi:ornithine cyclodeaminase/alanine dehydrogenase-like protein (mu-crystallin family)